MFVTQWNEHFKEFLNVSIKQKCKILIDPGEIAVNICIWKDCWDMNHVQADISLMWRHVWCGHCGLNSLSCATLFYVLWWEHMVTIFKQQNKHTHHKLKYQTPHTSLNKVAKWSRNTHPAQLPQRVILHNFSVVSVHSLPISQRYWCRNPPSSSPGYLLICMTSLLTHLSSQSSVDSSALE